MKKRLRGIFVICTLLLLVNTGCRKSAFCPAYPGHANTTISMSKFSKGKKAHERKAGKHRSSARARKRNRKRLFKSRY